MKRNGWLFTCLIILLPAGFSFGDQPGSQPAYLRSYRAAEKRYQDENTSPHNDSLALAGYLDVIRHLERTNLDDSALWDSYYKAGILFQTFGKYDRALPLLVKCLSFSGVRSPVGETAFYLPNIYAGNSYYLLNRFDSARYFFREAEAIAARHPGIAGLERLYNTLGVINYETGNYVQSSYYFEKALSTLDASGAKNDELEVTYKNNLASVYTKQERYDEAMQIYRGLLHYNINKDELLHNIGTIYLNKGDNRKAIASMRAARGSDQNTMNDLGLAYLNLGQHDSAQYYLQAAFVLNSKNNGIRKNTTQGITYKLTADLMARQQRFDAALASYQQALIQMVDRFNDADVNHNPVAFEGIFSFNELFEVLLAKAQAFQSRFEVIQNLHDLEASVAAYESAYRLADYVGKSYGTDEARLFLNKMKYLSHSKPIDVCMRLFELTRKQAYLEQAFFFDEKNKASALSINLQESRLKSVSGIPAALLEKENDLKQSITRYALKASEGADTTGHETQAMIRDLSLQLTALQETFDQYPDYRRLKYADNTVTIAALQQRIPNKAAVLSYHMGDSSLVAFLVTRDRFHANALPIADSLLPVIFEMQKNARNTEGTNRERDRMQASYLYDQLLQPFDSLLVDSEQLIIIPDDELSLVPFEILTNRGKDLVLKKFAISYNYSCSLLISDGKEKRKDYSLFAMAPFNEPRAGIPGTGEQLAALPASGDEIVGLKGDLLFGKAATRDAFLQEAPRYSIIHLATHATANDQDPMRSYISFYPAHPDSAFSYKLFIPEIYHLQLKATSLVVLSACETGEGQLVKGEGVMSLSRAFSYAGCPKIIMSLWKADDRATAFISKRLHHYLEKKLTVAKALQQAKLDYLESDAIAARVRVPAYWAHLRLIGDLEETPAAARYWTYLVVALLMIAAGLLVRRMWRKQE